MKKIATLMVVIYILSSVFVSASASNKKRGKKNFRSTDKIYGHLVEYDEIRDHECDMYASWESNSSHRIGPYYAFHKGVAYNGEFAVIIPTQMLIDGVKIRFYADSVNEDMTNLDGKELLFDSGFLHINFGDFDPSLVSSEDDFVLHDKNAWSNADTRTRFYFVDNSKGKLDNEVIIPANKFVKGCR